jgi:predicted O-methyltransferase YrrM
VAELLNWTDVEGWLTEEEGTILRSYAVGARVLELGSFLGRSTVCMAQVASHLVSIDRHEGDGHTGPADTLAGFLKNLEAAGVKDRVEHIVMAIEDIPPRIPKQPDFDMAFVDVYHDKPTTELATRFAMKSVKPGGHIFWHDYHLIAVRDAITACGLRPRDNGGSLAWCRV